MKILNCGITGGQRDVMLKFLTRMVQVLQDPALAIRQKNEDINLSPDMEKSVASQKEVQDETAWKQHSYWFCYHSCVLVTPRMFFFPALPCIRGTWQPWITFCTLSSRANSNMDRQFTRCIKGRGSWWLGGCDGSAMMEAIQGSHFLGNYPQVRKQTERCVVGAQVSSGGVWQLFRILYSYFKRCFVQKSWLVDLCWKTTPCEEKNCKLHLLTAWTYNQARAGINWDRGRFWLQDGFTSDVAMCTISSCSS